MPTPPNDRERVDAVTAKVRGPLDSIARAAAIACGVPTGYVALLGEETRTVVAGKDDVGEVERTFHAEAPIVDCAGRTLGTLCVADRVPHVLSPDQKSILQELSVAAGKLLTAETESRRAADDLARRNELLSLAESAANVGHWRIDVEDGTLFWSPQVYRIHGRDPATFVPDLATAIDVYHPDDRERITTLVRSAIERAEPYEFDARVVRPNGEIRRVHSKGECARDPATGKTRVVFGVYQDVTERETARERLVKQERLVTVGTLAAGVGHEINNPLTFMSANIDMAIDEIESIGGGSPSARILDLISLLREAADGAGRIRKIVRGLRAFAREDLGLASIDVRAAVDVSANMAAHELRRRATLDLRLAPVPKVTTNESQLAQVLVNLLVNAAQAFPTSDPGRNLVVVKTLLTTGGAVAIEVSDNGPGIPPDVLARIFDPFFTTKGPLQGTGLGLSISQSVVTSLGGDLTCETVLGRGTTFRVVLPVGAPPAPTATTVEAPRKVLHGKIMVVDDELPILRALSRFLGSEHEVVCHGDARDAQQALEQDGDSFDAVFCDITMPHLSGIDLHRAIAARHPALAARFVFMTGGAAAPEVQTFLDEIPNPRLEKPFDNEDVRSTARRLVDAGSRRRAKS